MENPAWREDNVKDFLCFLQWHAEGLCSVLGFGGGNIERDEGRRRGGTQRTYDSLEKEVNAPVCKGEHKILCEENRM